MDSPHPQKINLADEEEAILSQINFKPKDIFGSIEHSSLALAASLADSILSRKAVPTIRLHYFSKAEFNIGSKKSHMEWFEAHGTKGEDILKHGNFLPYLRYFIFGPNLPEKIIGDFYHLATQSDGGRKEMRKFVRNMTRQFGLNSREACEEFFKLAIECEMNVDDARAIRDAVRTIR